MLGLNEKIEPTDKLIAGLSNKIIPSRGQITLPLQLGNSEIKHAFIICDTLDNEF